MLSITTLQNYVWVPKLGELLVESKLNIQPLDEWGIKEEIKKYITNK